MVDVMIFLSRSLQSVSVHFGPVCLRFTSTGWRFKAHTAYHRKKNYINKELKKKILSLIVTDVCLLHFESETSLAQHFLTLQ